MKTLINITVAFLLATNNAFAFFDVVTDPTSYTYYAKQIKAMNDQIKGALDQLNVLNDVNKGINEASDFIFNAGERIYDPTRQIKNLVSNIQSTQRRFVNLAERVRNMGAERFLKDYHDIDAPLEKLAYEKWKNNMTGLFDNSEDELYQELHKKLLKAQQAQNYLQYQQAVNNISEYLRLKELEQNALIKASLSAPIDLYNEYFANADVVEERENRAKEIQDLVSQINSEKDLMKQQQITNLILIKMLETIDNQYQMQMRYYYAMTLPQMKNISSSIKLDLEKLKEEKEEFEKAEKVKQAAAKKALDEYGKMLRVKGEKSEIYRILSGKQDFQEY